MALTNIEPAAGMRSLASRRRLSYVTKTVKPQLEEHYIFEGWQVLKRNESSVRLRKDKSLATYFEDRVWHLMYKLGFASLSGEGGAGLVSDAKEEPPTSNQIDVAAVDEDVALAIECKTSNRPARRPQFQQELGKFVLLKAPFTAAIRKQQSGSSKKQIAFAIFTCNAILSESDRKRASDQSVTLLDEKDLAYYEDLVAHLGPAARFQFLADLLQGKTVQGLEITVPAIKAKMGGAACYTFSVNPEYLLKIAYVSHRAKGKASDVDAYQRMIKRSRLNSIREYIRDDGIFPTNIVVNLEKRPTFQQTAQESDHPHGIMGWLRLKPTYKSAWIIDGQHRLFAYSGMPEARKARLSVLAFDGLAPSKQAQLFIDINAEQKSVKQSLLIELYAELHWNSLDPTIRMRAIVAKAVQSLAADPESPFYQRVMASDDKQTDTRCISFTALVRALNHPELYVTTVRGIVEHGPLSRGEDAEATRVRTVRIVNFWFDLIRNEVPDWWDAGRGDGGGLSMNDAVTACLNVLRSVFQSLGQHGEKLLQLDDEDLCGRVRPYGDAMAAHLLRMTLEERQRFREFRGVQGQTYRTRLLQQAIHERFPAFNPPDLERFIEESKAQTNSRAKDLVDRIERSLQQVVIGELRQEFGLDEEAWWFTGVPQGIRRKVSDRQEQDDGKRGGKEHYFDLVDYRDLIKQHWSLLGDLLGYDSAGQGKEKRTAWVLEVNEIRKLVAHSSSGRSVTLEQLERLEQYAIWLTERLSGLAA